MEGERKGIAGMGPENALCAPEREAVAQSVGRSWEVGSGGHRVERCEE